MLAVTLAAYLMIPSLPYNGLPELVFVFVVSPVLVAVGSVAKPSRLVDGPLRVLGQASYPLYVVHYPIVARLVPLLSHREPALIAAVGGLVLAMILLGQSLDRWYDRPVRRHILRSFESRRSADADNQANQVAAP